MSPDPLPVPGPCRETYDRYAADLGQSALAASTRTYHARCVRRFLRWLPANSADIGAVLTQPTAWRPAATQFTAELAAAAGALSADVQSHRNALADCARRLGLAEPYVSVPERFRWAATPMPRQPLRPASPRRPATGTWLRSAPSCAGWTSPATPATCAATGPPPPRLPAASDRQRQRAQLGPAPARRAKPLRHLPWPAPQRRRHPRQPAQAGRRRCRSARRRSDGQRRWQAPVTPAQALVSELRERGLGAEPAGDWVRVTVPGLPLTPLLITPAQQPTPTGRPSRSPSAWPRHRPGPARAGRDDHPGSRGWA